MTFETYICKFQDLISLYLETYIIHYLIIHVANLYSKYFHPNINQPFAYSPKTHSAGFILHNRIVRSTLQTTNLNVYMGISYMSGVG